MPTLTKEEQEFLMWVNLGDDSTVQNTIGNVSVDVLKQAHFSTQNNIRKTAGPDGYSAYKSMLSIIENELPGGVLEKTHNRTPRRNRK